VLLQTRVIIDCRRDTAIVPVPFWKVSPPLAFIVNVGVPEAGFKIR